MLRSVLLLLIIILFATTIGQAQQDSYAQYEPKQVDASKLKLTFALQTAIPQGEFAADVPKAGFGTHLQLGYRLPALPLELALSLDFLFYGYQRAERLVGPVQPSTFEIEVDRFQYMLPLHLHLRYAPEWGKFTPHAEVFGGMRLIASRTRALGNALISTPDNPEAFSARADFYDISFSYGVGAGLSYTIAAMNNVEYQLSLGGRLLRGGKANYLGASDLQLNGNQLIYNPRYNTTKLAVVQLGFSFLF